MKKFFTQTSTRLKRTVLSDQFLNSVEKLDKVFLIIFVVLLLGRFIIKESVYHQIEILYRIFEITSASLGFYLLVQKNVRKWLRRRPHIPSNSYTTDDNYLQEHLRQLRENGVETNFHIVRHVNPGNYQKELLDFANYLSTMESAYLKADILQLSNLFIRLYEHNPDIFILVFNKTSNQITGGTVSVPMKKETSNSHYQGYETLYTLDIKQVAPRGHKVNFINLHKISLAPENKCPHLIKAFETTVYYQVAWSVKDCKHVVLYGENQTPQLANILANFGHGVANRKNTGFGHHIVELYFNNEKHRKAKVAADKKVLDGRIVTIKYVNRLWGFINATNLNIQTS